MNDHPPEDEHPDAVIGPPRLSALELMTVTVIIVVTTFTIVLLVDGYGLILDDGEILFLHLYHRRPIEWLQFLILAAVVGGGAYVAGRLTAHRDDPQLGGGRRFWLLISAGSALMLIEETADIRHDIPRGWPSGPGAIRSWGSTTPW